MEIYLLNGEKKKRNKMNNYRYFHQKQLHFTDSIKFTTPRNKMHAGIYFIF